jgi:TRAP-type C4-dicarboxylate transport system permease small subunit
VIKLVSAAARFFTRVAAVFLVAMVLLNVVDVGLRSGFNAPIFGTYEIIELLLAAVAFLAIPEAFMRGQHITIELIDQVVPQRVVDALRAFGMLCTVGFLCLLTWFMVQPALDFIEFNEVSIDLQIPAIWGASLILAGMVLSLIAAATVFVRDVRTLISNESEQ